MTLQTITQPEGYSQSVIILYLRNIFIEFLMSGGELLELRLLDTQLLNTFGSKSIARHKFYQLLESS
jgi:hypothetical protein